MINPDQATRRALTELALILSRKSDKDAIKKAVISNLERLGRPCLTNGCEHGLKRGSKCTGYYTVGTLLTLQGYSLQMSKVIVPSLVQPFFCTAFTRIEDTAKSTCRDCSEKGYSMRGDFDGLYCHGCGLFIHFEEGSVGYAEEWTTGSIFENQIASEPQVCKRCGSNHISMKFGDYPFCSKPCLRAWYVDIAGPDSLVPHTS